MPDQYSWEAHERRCGQTSAAVLGSPNHLQQGPNVSCTSQHEQYILGHEDIKFDQRGIVAWADPQSWLSAGMAPSPWAIAITAIVVLSIPLFLHLVIYRSTSTTTLPSFLLVGPSGAGKTALLTLVFLPFSNPSFAVY
jgi:hypothetical protein